MVTGKGPRFEWGPELERAMQQVQAAVQAALPLGPYDPPYDLGLGDASAEKGVE